MSLKKLAFFSLFAGALVLATPIAALAEEAPSEAQANEEAGHGAHQLNWYDFTKDAPPIVALVFNFLCLVTILFFILRNPLKERFANRQATLETALKEAADMKAKAEKALGEARAKMEALDLEMANLREEILGAGKNERARVLEEAEEQSERIRADAKVMVEQEIARMTQGIREEVVDEVIGLAKERIEERIERSDHDRIVQGYLNSLRPKTTVPPPPAGSAD